MHLVSRRNVLNFEMKIAIIILIVGLTMMFLIPTWQTPDEYTHLKLIGSSIHNENFASIIAEHVNISGSRIMTHYEEKMDMDEFIASLSSKPSYDKQELMPQGLSLSVIKHLPSTTGILFGIVIGLPMYWVLQLGELFSLLFYIIVCYYALKIMPIKKELFAIVLLMPMALQQAGGIGYDAVLLPLCFYWIAYVLHLKFKDEIHSKDLLCLILLWGGITYVKMPYMFLILLILTLPLEKIHLRVWKLDINKNVIKKYSVPFCLVGGLTVIVAMYLLRDYFWIQLVLGLIKEWRRTIWLLIQTGRTWHEMLITSSVGNFGWLDTPICYGVAVLVYVVITMFAVVNSHQTKELCFSRWDRMVIWGTWIALCVFTAFAMVNHTIMMTLYGSEHALETYDIRTALYQIPYIGGLQGRYFLPFITLLFLPFPQLKQMSGKKTRIGVLVFETVLCAYIMYVLLCRYWIA